MSTGAGKQKVNALLNTVLSSIYQGFAAVPQNSTLDCLAGIALQFNSFVAGGPA